MSDSADKVACLEEPMLLPFLPMLYVAWADSELSRDELAALGETVSSLSGLDAARRRSLEAWLNPDSPPTAAELVRLLATIRRSAHGESEAERLSLAELGATLAAESGHRVGPTERNALEELEVALGLAGQRSVSGRLLAVGRSRAEADEAPAAFPVAALGALLDGAYGALRRELEEVLTTPRFRRRRELDRHDYRRLVLEWARALARRGYGKLGYPESVGGGGDTGAAIAAFETIAYHDLSLLVKFGVQFGLFGGSIQQLGTAEHHRRYLPAVASLELPGCFAMTETGHGSNVSDLETVIRFDAEGGELVVHTPHEGAGKDYIGNAAAHGRMATVFGQLEVGGERHGVHAVLVPIRDDRGEPLPGVRIEDCGDKLGLDGVDNGRLWFDRVRVPRENLLDRFGSVSPDGEYSSPIASPPRRFFTMLGTLVSGRVSIALAAVSAAKSALTIAIRYGARRRQFGRPGEPETVLLDYLTHQRRLMPRLATTYALHFALRDLVADYLAADGDEGRREVELAAAGLKAVATGHATDTIQACRECCGGQGYLAENRFAALKADTDVFTTFEGDNTVLLQLVAKGLLTGYKRQFGEMNLLGLARYVAGQAALAVAELNPVVTRLASDDHLLDRGFHLAALAWRESHQVSSLARRIKKRLDAGADIADALTAVQDHLLSVAISHVEHRVLERFAAAVEGCEEPGVATMLGTVCDLWALARIEADRGWFLEHGYLEKAKSRAITELVNRLCGEVRRQALPLVDAFAIPDELVGAPIGRR